MMSRSWVPRTMESSQKRRRLPAISSRIGMSFMLRDEVAHALVLRHEAARPGRRVLDERAPVRDARLGGVADGVPDAGVGNAGHAVDLDACRRARAPRRTGCAPPRR